MKYLDIVSRFLIALVFILAGANKVLNFNETVGVVANAGLPFATVLTVIVIFIEIVVATAFVFGYKKCATGGTLIAFTALTIIFMYRNLSDPNEIIHILKNLAIIGGVLAVIGKCDCGKCPMSEEKSN